MTRHLSHDSIIQSAEMILQWQHEVNDDRLPDEDRWCAAHLLSMEIDTLKDTIDQTSLYWVFPILKVVEANWVQEHQLPVPNGGFGQILTYETQLGEPRSLNRSQSWQYAEAVSELSPRVGDEIRHLALDLVRNDISLWSLNNLVEALVGRPIVEPIDDEPLDVIEHNQQVDWRREGF